MYRRAYTQHNRRVRKYTRKPYTCTFRGGTPHTQTQAVRIQLSSAPTTHPFTQNIQLSLNEICTGFAETTDPLLDKIRRIITHKAVFKDIASLSTAINELEHKMESMENDFDQLYSVGIKNLMTALFAVFMTQHTAAIITVPPEIGFIHTEVVRAMRAECAHNARIEKLLATKMKDGSPFSFMRAVMRDTIVATEYVETIIATDEAVLHRITQPMTEKERRKRNKSTEVPTVVFNINKIIRILLKTHCRLNVARMVLCHTASAILVPAVVGNIQVWAGRESVW